MTTNQHRLYLFGPLIIVLVLGMVLGVALGYSIWSPSANKYSTILLSTEATRMVQIGRFSVVFPSVTIAPIDNNTTMTIEITNLDDDPRFVDVILSLVASSTIDGSTIGRLTANRFQATLAGDGSVIYTISIRPSSTGYVVLDLWIRGELAGSMILYVVD